MYLETERLVLRPWSVDDAEECYRYACDPQVGPAAGWPPHRSVEESRLVIEKFLSNPTDYAIIWKETNLPIGAISLKFNSDLASGDDECELGYWLGAPYWGRGIMPEAGREMLRHAFEDLKMTRVWCGYYEGNEKSRRVQEKLGFRFQWRSEDVEVPQVRERRVGYVNCLTREQWIADISAEENNAERIDEQKKGKTTMEFKEVIRNRYSCKKYSDRQVEPEKLNAILEAGRLAPTAKNLQEQHVYVVQSPEALAKIDEATPCRYGAPTVLVVAFDRDNVFTYPGGKRNSGVEDATIVATHMILAAADEGVDSCWLNYLDPEQLAQSLGLPENEEILMVMDLGYGTEEAGPLPNHYNRKPLEETVSYL